MKLIAGSSEEMLRAARYELREARDDSYLDSPISQLDAKWKNTTDADSKNSVSPQAVLRLFMAAFSKLSYGEEDLL
jgi:hypothetical protein